MALYEKTELLCVYESTYVPGILQTHGYVKALFQCAERLYSLPDGEAQAAADARLPRQRLVTAGTGKNRYSFVIEAAVLDLIFGSAEIMIEQFDFLLEVTRLPNVAFGIIPLRRVRTLYPGEGFYMFDGRLVRSELWSGGFQAKQGDEIATFVKAFAMLREQAVYGHAARELIEAAKSRLQLGETA